jgi:thiamine biosynthesis lipoprotein
MKSHKYDMQDTVDRMRHETKPPAVYILLSAVFFFTVCCLLSALSSCSPKERMFKKSRALMDTFVTITVVSDSENDSEKAIDSAFMEIEKLEKMSSFFLPDSEISRINKSAGISEVKVSPEILELLTRARYVSECTGGAFDITIGPVEKLYDFYKKAKPEGRATRQCLRLVDYKNLIIDRNKSTVFLRKRGMLIDPGGIAKGYAADKAVETLKKNGITSGLVAVAGDIKAFGLKPDRTRWKIGIRDPRAEDEGNNIMATLELSGKAISTSGDYERFFILDGKRYHHILSPKTGLPAPQCQSVSVITRDASFTDAFATGVFVLGPAEGIKVLEKTGFEGIIVDSRGKIHMTPGTSEKVEFKKTS